MTIKDQLHLPKDVKIATYASPEPSADELAFLQAVGVQYVTCFVDGAKASPEYYLSRKQVFADAGLTLYGLGNLAVHNQDALVLNLPGRDAKIEEYQRHLQYLGYAGIPYTTYAHMANGIWSSPRETSRGASARAFNLNGPGAGNWAGRVYDQPLSHGRAYSAAELWDNFAYFIRQVAPVAEDQGVLIGIHPDDPPGPTLSGVPRCLFSSFDGYERALQIAASPNVGLCLCVGCWLEGGPAMGKDVIETIHHYGAQGKLFKVHFRNVDQPLPHFVESWLNNGYQDMRPVMQALVEVGFEGVCIPDHTPTILDTPYIGTAYTLGYMQALLASETAYARQPTP
ncbi:MAG: mannonate dehydratase [Anaerolineales bacterium]|nr:mannonate dehydratase [Anaerolineales bacterium]